MVGAKRECPQIHTSGSAEGNDGGGESERLKPGDKCRVDSVESKHPLEKQQPAPERTKHSEARGVDEYGGVGHLDPPENDEDPIESENQHSRLRLHRRIGSCCGA